MRFVSAAAIMLAVGGALLILNGQAFADTVAVTIDDASPMLSDAESGYTVSLDFTNLSDAEIGLHVAAGDAEDAGCDLTVSPIALPAATRETVTVTVPVACAVAEDGFDFIVVTQSADGTQEFPVSAAPAPTDDPDWSELAAFPVALLGAIIILCLALGAWIVWLRPKGETTTGTGDAEGGGSSSATEDAAEAGGIPSATGDAAKAGGNVSAVWAEFRAPLEYLDTTYSFKDSWVSNVTVISGLLTGIFGSSETLKAFLGEEADQAVALSTIGAAVALAFVGAGPIFLLAAEKGGENRAPTVFGLLIASALTLAGAFGEIWIVFKSASKLELGGLEKNVWLPSLAAATLLLVYAVRAFLATIHDGQTKPKQTDPDAVAAAKLIVEALKAHTSIESSQVDAALRAYPTVYPRGRTSPGDDTRRRRSAIL